MRFNVLSACCGVMLAALVSQQGAWAADQPDFGVTSDWGGFRTKLDNEGIDLGAFETLDFFGNPTGGTTQGTILEGRLEMILDVDFDKLADMKGLTAHANAYQIHGRGLSASDLGNNINTATNIEADRGTILFDMWGQQNFLNDFISLRVGQIAADDEFTVSQYEALFVSSAYGWPNSIATNLPGGGPAYPLATPGVRLRLGDSDPWSFMTAVFDGDPSGGGVTGTAQSRNPGGTAFPLDHGALVMSEVGYARKGDAIDWPGTYKVGAWYHTGKCDDPRTGTDGLSLADPSSHGIAQKHDGNYGFYGVMDQMLWHTPDSRDHGIGGFLRALWNPSDRNIVAGQLDAGINVIGMISEREKDIVGLAFTYLPISDRAANLDRDTNRFNATNAPVRDYESQIELTYQAPVMPWLTVQPDFQYIMHPGGHVSDPTDPSGTKPIGDEAVLGLRLIAKF